MSRRRWVYRPNETGGVDVIDVSPDYQRTAERVPVVCDRYMEGTRSPVDGSDIGSRAKRREHMRAHGLVDANDYAGEWKKAAEKRAEFKRTGEDGKDWAGRMAETLKQMQQRRR